MTLLTAQRISTILLCLSMVALGAGLGVMWASAATMASAPWIHWETAQQLRSMWNLMTYAAAAVFGLCSVLFVGLETRVFADG